MVFNIHLYDQKIRSEDTGARRDSRSRSTVYQKDYLQKKGEKGSRHSHQAASYLELLGGKDNVVEVTNCATRLKFDSQRS